MMKSKQLQKGYYAASQKGPHCSAMDAMRWISLSNEESSRRCPLNLVFFWGAYDKNEGLPWEGIKDFFESAEEPVRILIAIPAPSPDWQCDIWPGYSPHWLLKSLIEDLNASGAYDACKPWTSFEDLPDRLTNTDNWAKWTRPKGDCSQLIRYCNCMGILDKKLEVARFLKLGKDAKESAPMTKEDITTADLHRFLDNPTGYATRELHGVSPDEAVPTGRITVREGIWARKIEVLEFLSGRLFVPRSLPLKILVVDNNINGLEGWANHSANVFGHLKSTFESHPFGWLKKAKWYVLNEQKQFEQIRTATGRFEIKGMQLWKWRNERWEREPTNRTIKMKDWDKFDLVLQDIMLDRRDKEPTGLDLVPRYLELCPQALVFALTGMDVESLVRSGDIIWQYLDGVIPKRRLGSLWWQYYQAFCRRFGRMFWQPWLNAEDRKGKARIEDRQSLRNLFGNLHKWALEPSILAHGQAVQEMIDHGHRHVSGLWQLADDVIGNVVENSAPTNGDLSVPDRMLFAMAVWLHDVGHRGDDFTATSTEIRVNHAGISEYLLLRDPKAFGIDWLMDFCIPECKNKKIPSGVENNFLLECRNRLNCKSDERGELCPIRKLGLMCRHHQSNAPLDNNSLEEMRRKNKFPSPYTRVNEAHKNDEDFNSQADLEEWLDLDRSLVGWTGSVVRVLDEFSLGHGKDGFISMTGLLRMLDALQLHRSRVGTPTCIESFKAYLGTRSEWCKREIDKVNAMLSKIHPGTPAYQKTLSDYSMLRFYERLVNVQYVHFWRQMCVHDIAVKWIWKSGGNAALQVVYQLDEWGLNSLKDLKTAIRYSDGKVKPLSIRDVINDEVDELVRNEPDKFKRLESSFSTGTSPLSNLCKAWAIQVRDDVVLSEHNSQKPKNDAKKSKRDSNEPKRRRPLYVQFLPEDVDFEICCLEPSSPDGYLKMEHFLLDKADF